MISGFYIGFHSDNTKAKFKVFNDLQDLINNSDVIFLTVTDGAIAKVWSRLENYNIKDKIICHCSGSLSSEVFINADKYNAHVCSVHPILAFETYNVSISKISKAYFTIEGNYNAVKAISNILDNCNNKYFIIDSKYKIKYHLAACFASNFVISICKKAVNLMNECGFSNEDALRALMPLIVMNCNNISEKGIDESLTGPVERNDYLTVLNHLNVLDNNDKKLYSMLTKILVDIAKQKYNDRDYSAMEELL